MAAIPKIPVVAIIEGRCPKPEPKRAVPKIVLLTAAGLNLSQLYKKVLGPVPKTMLFFNDCLVMPKVADHEGRTSVKETPKALLIFPAVPLNKIKKQLLLSRIKTGEEIFWFQLFLFHPQNGSLITPL